MLIDRLGNNYDNAFHDIMDFSSNSHPNEYDIAGGNSGTLTGLGSDGKYVAVSGYDLATGWGTPKGAGTISALVAFAATPVKGTGFDCTALTDLIKHLDTDWQNAKNRLKATECEGPGIFQCQQAADALKTEIAAESAIAKTHHCAIPPPPA